jgi:prepilin-type N-terminal cleavage/methylation domain-containing protein
MAPTWSISRSRAFTLIELLLVIAIIAVLSLTVHDSATLKPERERHGASPGRHGFAVSVKSCPSRFHAPDNPDPKGSACAARDVYAAREQRADGPVWPFALASAPRGAVLERQPRSAQMKTRAALAAMLLASAANADVVINFGSASLAGGDTTVQTQQLSGTLLAFVISYDFEPDAAAQANGSWASDAALAIQSPITVPVQWGGYDIFVAQPNPVFVDYWSFDGSQSANPGPYTDIRQDIPIGMFGTGDWTITFGNGYSASTPVQYNSITVTLVGLQQVPAPSGAAALGIAGLGLMRRRRR